MIAPQILTIVALITLGGYALYNLKKNFSERAFFKIGMLLFIIQGLSNTYGIIFFEWGIVPWYAMIARVASTLFNFLLAYFFYYLMNNAPASMGGAGTQLSPEEINKFLEDEEENN
jgi:hypothetical protein